MNKRNSVSTSINACTYRRDVLPRFAGQQIDADRRRQLSIEQR